jgi:hypothetical protein
MVGGQLRHAEIESDGVCHAFQHGALQIVILDDARNPAEEMKGVEVSTNEALHPRVEIESHEYHAGVGKYHHEGHQGAFGISHGEFSEVGPIDLGLLAWQSA